MEAEHKKKKSLARKILRPRNIVFSIVFLLFASLGWFGFRVFKTWNSISDSSNGILPPALTHNVDQLRGEGDGRVNILILGMGGAGHSGGSLADTIMIASIDPETGHTAMLSLPRDLYVPIPDTKTSTKINAAYAIGEGKKKGGGAKLMKQTIANILDISIHYYVRVDFKGFEKIINTVGGVTVNNKTYLYDNSYPCDGLQGYCPFKLDKGTQKLDGKTALKYARCRKGTCGNDFGRASRQQEIAIAVGKKVRGSETLLNPIKINEILSNLGSHVRTDVGLREMTKFIDIGKKVDTKTIKSFVLTNQSNNYLVSAYSPGAGYILKPRAGNFSKIRSYVHKIFEDPFLKKENAKIELLNGSLANGLATQLAKLLKDYSYNIVKVGEADRRDYRDTVIVDYTSGKKPYTIKYLELRFGVKATKEPRGDKENDILVIVGNNFKPS